MGFLEKMLCLVRLRIVPRRRLVSTAARQVLSLIRSCADAPTAAAETRPTAFGLALVVLEHEEVIVAGNKLGSCERLIGGRVSPAGYIVARREDDTIVAANGLILLFRSTRI